ncbi:MAG: hypothetical protein CMJ81_04695 [Planctomycetaceae bacterium]|nr:hypothetical protein [Planctomycetaceae bacterium]MBP63682.1 hypothetical protein [Planctomycetaceae bacterium]
MMEKGGSGNAGEEQGGRGTRYGFEAAGEEDSHDNRRERISRRFNLNTFHHWARPENGRTANE